MKNTVAVTVGLKYRFEDFEVGTVLKCDTWYFMKVSTPKYPLVNLATGQSYHWSGVSKMKFEPLNIGTRVTITVASKQSLRVHNVYKRVKKPTEKQVCEGDL